MVAYESPRSEVVTHLEASVGAFLTRQILAAIDSGRTTHGMDVSILSDFRPGAPIPPGTDIVVVAPGVTGGLTVPDGVGAVVFTGPAGVQVTLVAENSTAVQLTDGADVLRLAAIDTGDPDQFVAVNGGAGDDVIHGAANIRNLLEGGAGNDTLIGGDKGDLFVIGEGGDRADGGAGYDQAYVRGAASDYHRSLNEDGSISLTHKLTGDVSRLTDVEFVVFEKGGILLNVNSEASFATASLYEVIFGRTADAAGHEHFAGQDGGQLIGSANAMLHSEEFTEKFGPVEGMSDAEFLNLIYRSAFNRDADADGLDYWLSKLAGGMTKGEVALNFACSSEIQDVTDPVIVSDKKYYLD